MSLNLSKLEKVRELGNGSVQARCPACAEAGHDRQGEHLRIGPDGRFGCCVYPKDHAHRKRIFALAGDKTPRKIRVRAVPVQASAPPIVSGVLGRLGRVFASPDEQTYHSDASDGCSEVDPQTPMVRTLRTGETKSCHDHHQNSRTLRTGPVLSTHKEKDDDVHVQGLARGASEPSEPSTGSHSEEGVRAVRMPHLTPGGVLVIPFDSPERFHWWKEGGQSVAQTRAEVERGFA